MVITTGTPCNTFAAGTRTSSESPISATHHPSWVWLSCRRRAGMPDAPALKRRVAPLIAAAIVLLLSHKNQVAAAAAAAPWKFSAFATSTTRKIRNTKQTKSTAGILAKPTEVQQLRFMTLPPATPEGAGTSTSTSFDPNELDYLKAELTAYLSRRQELGADEAAKRYVFGA